MHGGLSSAPNSQSVPPRRQSFSGTNQQQMAAASQPRGPASPRHGSPTASMKARHNNGGLNGLEEEDPLLKDLELNKQPSQKLHSGEERALGKPKRVLGLPASVLAGALYCMASMGMVSGGARGGS